MQSTAKHKDTAERETHKDEAAAADMLVGHSKQAKLSSERPKKPISKANVKEHPFIAA